MDEAPKGAAVTDEDGATKAAAVPDEDEVSKETEGGTDEDGAPKAAAVTDNDEEGVGTITTIEGNENGLETGVTPPLDTGVAVLVE